MRPFRVRRTRAPHVTGGPRSDILRWVGCFAVVLGAHAGALAALLHTGEPPEVLPPQPVMMIELAAAIAAPQSEAQPLPPGPRRQQSRPREQVAEQAPEKEAIKEKIVPKAEVPVARRSQPKPRKDAPPTPPIPQSEPQPQQQPAADTATAPPAVAAPAAPVAAAPAPGVAEMASPAHTPAWRAALLAHLKRHLRYPAIAQARQQEGVVWLRFAMDCHGKVLSSAIKQSSSHDILDREALAVLQRAQPLPAPKDSTAERIEVAVPVDFFLR